MLTLNWLNPWRRIGPQQLARWAASDGSPQPRAWRPMTALSALQRNSVSRFLRVTPARWQTVPSQLDPEALAFDGRNVSHSEKAALERQVEELQKLIGEQAIEIRFLKRLSRN